MSARKAEEDLRRVGCRLHREHFGLPPGWVKEGEHSGARAMGPTEPERNRDRGTRCAAQLTLGVERDTRQQGKEWGLLSVFLVS